MAVHVSSAAARRMCLEQRSRIGSLPGLVSRLAARACSRGGRRRALGGSGGGGATGGGGAARSSGAGTQGGGVWAQVMRHGYTAAAVQVGRGIINALTPRILLLLNEYVAWRVLKALLTACSC
ncbi:unnamed protein product [Closterium sp. NIES-54]